MSYLPNVLIEKSGRMYLRNTDLISQDNGINKHNWLTAFFVRVFGSGIVKCSTEKGSTFYFNKQSLITWLKTQYSNPQLENPNYPKLTIQDSEQTLSNELDRFLFSLNLTQIIADSKRKGEILEGGTK